MEKRYGFPNELVDRIVKNLYLDTATLLKCSLVGKAWVYPAQRGIFQELDLDVPASAKEPTDQYSNRMESLATLFAEKPSLASYVRTLRVRGALFGLDAGRVPVLVSIVWTRLIKRLPNVNRLSLCAIAWGVMDIELKEALTDLVRVAPSLTHVSVIEFTIPRFAELVTFLGHAAHLKVLRASQVQEGYDYSRKTLQETTPRSIQLDELVLENDVRLFMDWVEQDSCALDLQNLKGLRINRYPFPCRSFPEFEDMLRPVQYLGRNLCELSLLDLDVKDPNSYLEHTPNLRILHLNLSNTDTVNAVPVILALLKPVLDKDEKLPLEQMRIILCQSRYDPSESHDWESWSEIDTLFAKPEFASLETLEFNLFVGKEPTPSALSCAQIKELLIENLPLSKKSGKLVIMQLLNDTVC